MQTTSAPSAASARLVDFEGLPAITGTKYSKFHQRRLEQAGKFPRRIYLTPQRPVWSLDELEAWIATRAAARGATT